MLEKNNETEIRNEIVTNEKQPPKRSIWFWINILVVLAWFFSGAFLFSLATLGIYIILFPVLIIVNAILAIVYKKYMMNKKGKIQLNTLRFTAVAIMAVIVLSPAVVLNFENTSGAYLPKKFVYTYGVGNTKRCRQVFPKSLPDNCEDYIFITQSSIGGLQDYYPSAYLIFHSDSDTLRKYEENISSLGIAERFENTPKDPKDYYDEDDDDEYKEQMYIQMNCPDMLPGHVYYRFCYEISDNLGNAVIYLIDNDKNRGFAPNRGCMLNYESGLAVFWV